MEDNLEQVVLDIETQKGFDEVEGRRLDLMGVSVVGIYSYKESQYKAFLEKDLAGLAAYLKEARLVIGFNIKRFDFPVLQPYFNFELAKLNTLDILEEVQNFLGFRLSLNSLAQATLNAGKSGTGLDALKYYRQGEWEQLIKYCQQDVLVTRQLYEYGKSNGHLLYRRGLGLETIPVNWAQGTNLEGLLRQVFQTRNSLEITYSSPNYKAAGAQTRLIDIYGMELGKVVAFCHLRGTLRTFNVRRILSAKATQHNYVIPADFDLQEFKRKSKFF